MIPVVTKIDLPNAQPEDAALAMATTFNLDPEDVIMTSAKRALGIREVLEAVVDKLPCPAMLNQEITQKGKNIADRYHGRIIDSWFDEYRGVVCLVQGITGCLREKPENHYIREH